MLKRIRIIIDDEPHEMAIDTEDSMFSTNEFIKVYSLYMKKDEIKRKCPDNAIVDGNVKCKGW